MIISKIVIFELRKKIKQLSTYVYFLLFFTITFLAVLSAGGAFQQGGVVVGGSGGKVLNNSPSVIFALISVIQHFGVIVTAAIMGQAVFQDFHHQTFTMFFTSPIHKLQFLIGRYLGNLIVLLGIFSSIGMGFWCATQMPMVDQKLFGPNLWASYLSPYIYSILPNLIFTGAVFFSLAALTRKILPVYASSVVLLIGYLIASVVTAEIENKHIAALLDPFGSSAFELVTQYWTPAEQNANQIRLIGMLFWNRLLWLSVAAVIFAFTAWRFKTNHGSESRGARREERVEPALGVTVAVPTTTSRNFRPLHHLPGLTWLNFKETVKNVYFAVIVLAGIMFIILAAQVMDSIFGTETYPVTATVVELAGGSFGLFVLIIIAFYAGELVWRERDTNIHQLMDVLPIPDWLPLISKTLALILVQVLLAAVIMVCGLSIQVVQGYFKFELPIYFTQLFGLNMAHYAVLCVIAISIQTLVAHKYVGHFLMIVYYLVVTFMPQFGLEHNLLRFGSSPGVTYSDMNGYGHFLKGIFWFHLYWFLWTVVLLIMSNLFWVRGTETTLSTRWKLARQRISTRTIGLAGLAFIGIGCVGSWIYYNTCILNEFQSSKTQTKHAAEYERKYKSLENEPQPRITDVKVDFDIFPDSRRLHAKGKMQIRNKTEKPIGRVYVQVSSGLDYSTLTVGSQTFNTCDEDYQLHTFKLAEPLQPGDQTSLEFEFDSVPKGFKNNAGDGGLVIGNGTFFNNGSLPQLGYQAGMELTDDDDRRRMKLPERERMAEQTDLAARANNYISRDADWISLESTVSTSLDQIAIVPGYLQKEWSAGERRYFHYKTDGRILNFYSVLSARYEVKREQWRGKVSFGKSLVSQIPEDLSAQEQQFAGTDQDVSIEIYYHRGHEYNLDSMVQAIKDSLDYNTANFSPYQHRQVRILEFPRYAQFAQAFPNTIPYSEGIGFIARVDPSDPKDINYPYYVTAHEIAHQWWAHQVIGANVRGATFMSESLAQYSALMVMKKTLGEQQMKRFLKYEMDQYLQGRSFERKKELPLAFNENQQYIHYNKGSLIMYALQDYVGEATVNRALAKYIRQTGYQEPPYTVAMDLVELIENECPDDMKYLIKDFFTTITLFDNRAVSAKVSKIADGQYEVKLEVTAKKLRADEEGTDQEIPCDDWIDIGIVDAKNEPLLIERKKLVSGKNQFTFSIDKLPSKAGIDPLNKLIDRHADDNLITVTQ